MVLLFLLHLGDSAPKRSPCRDFRKTHLTKNLPGKPDLPRGPHSLSPMTDGTLSKSFPRGNEYRAPVCGTGPTFQATPMIRRHKAKSSSETTKVASIPVLGRQAAAASGLANPSPPPEVAGRDFDGSETKDLIAEGSCGPFPRNYSALVVPFDIPWTGTIARTKRQPDSRNPTLRSAPFGYNRHVG
jgi:hypothetical protein